ncbi:MAG TPA: 2-C-methyl-D-erythritol 4-phosphate cytidylyltransferase [Ruminiclostridium sp.]|nr:2-C-methyl-D-erythritol 4-phosphate cytidylyltransferase [Ruminiclostridium sp.]
MKKNAGAVGAIIVAAGRGNRMGLGYNKVLASLSGRPVIEWTIKHFADSGLIKNLVLVISPEDEDIMGRICAPFTDRMKLTLAFGGEDRQDSVYQGLKALHEEIGLVLIHDGARPFIDRELILRSIENAQKYGAACAGMPVKDTIKMVDMGNFICSTPERGLLWSAQTPQAFKKEIILESYDRAYQEGIRSTDDAGLAEAAGFQVIMFEGSYKNIKLTSAEDLIIAESIIKKL